MTPDPRHDTADLAGAASRRVARNAALLIAQPLLLNLISLAVTAYIIHSLGAEDFGRLTYANTMKDLFGSLAALGLSAVTVRDLVRGDEAGERYVGRMLVLRLLAGGLAYLLLVLVVELGGLLPDAPWAVLLAGTAIFPLLLTITIEDVFRARQEMQHIARIRMTAGLALTAAQVVALCLGGRLAALLAIFVGSAYLTLILAAITLVRRFYLPRPGFDPGFTYRVLSQGIVFYAGGLMGRLSQSVDKLILERMQGVASVGVFGAGATLLERLVVIPEGIGAAVYPALSGLAAKDRAAASQVLSRFVMLAAMVGLPAAVGGSLLAVPLIGLLAGDGYPGAATVLSIAIWTLPAWCFNQVFSFALSAIHKERKGLGVVALGTALLVAGNLVLVPRWGPSGAAMALSVSQWVAAVLFALLCFRYYGRVVPLTQLPRLLLGLGLMALGVWSTLDLPLPVPLLLGAGIYAAVVGPKAWRLIHMARSARDKQ